MSVSKHFNLHDVEFNELGVRLGIPNKLPESLYQNAVDLAENVLDPLFEKLGNKVVITSWYRCSALEREYCKQDYIKWCVENRKAINTYSWDDYITTKGHTTAMAVCLRNDDEVWEACKELELTRLVRKQWISIIYDKSNLENRVIE